MGYLATGFAFGAPPDWEGLRRLLTGFHVRGYKHKELQLFLLDAWKDPAATIGHSPFKADPIQANKLPLAGVVPKPNVSVAFDAVCNLLRQSDPAGYDAGWLSLPLAIEAAARTPTFAFTADDDLFDFAALADSGALVRMGCRVGRFDLLLAGEGLRVLPRENDEDEDMQIEADLLSKISSVRNVEVLETARTSGGNRLYQYPTDLWPNEWGNPRDLLGFGSFDPLETFPDNFTLVFEATPSSDTLKPARVWRDLWTRSHEDDIGPFGAMASCMLWPVGILLACNYLLKSRRRKAVQAMLLGAAGLALMLFADMIRSDVKGSANLALIGYCVVSACAGVVFRSWLTRQTWLSRRGRG